MPYGDVLAACPSARFVKAAFNRHVNQLRPERSVVGAIAEKNRAGHSVKRTVRLRSLRR